MEFASFGLHAFLRRGLRNTKAFALYCLACIRFARLHLIT
jgi:hypothetical protein